MIDRRQHHEPREQTETDVADETIRLRAHDDYVVESGDFVGHNGDYDGEEGESSGRTLGHYQSFGNSIGFDAPSFHDHSSSDVVVVEGGVVADGPILKHIAIHGKATDCN